MNAVVMWILWSQVGWAWALGAPITEPARERPAQIAFTSSEACERAAVLARRAGHPTIEWVCLPDTVDPRAVHTLSRIGGLR